MRSRGPGAKGGKDRHHVVEQSGICHAGLSQGPGARRLLRPPRNRKTDAHKTPPPLISLMCVPLWMFLLLEALHFWPEPSDQAQMLKELEKARPAVKNSATSAPLAWGF